MKTNNTLIIAEAGVNHNGVIEVALDLVDAAFNAGANVVKFQTFNSNDLASHFAAKANYQQKNTGSNETQLEMLRKLELSHGMHLKIIDRCKEKGISFASTGFDQKSIDLLVELGVDFLKIPSGEITNLPYLRYIGSKNLPIILSTGMSTMQEVKDAMDILYSAGSLKSNITVLHCNTEYPSQMDDINLRAMLTMKNELGVKIGYSDHTLGIEVPIAAVAMGATVIEKHFTLDRNMSGPDHIASLEPHELEQMVTAIRNTEKAMGYPEKKPSPSEVKNIAIARRSIVAKKTIFKGQIFSELNLAVKRPGNGVSPMLWDRILGTQAKRDYKTDELIQF